MHPELLRLSSLRVPVCTQVRYKEKVLQQPRDPRIRFAYGNIDWYVLGNRPWHPGIVQVWGFHTLFSVRTIPVCISVTLPVSLPISLPVSLLVSLLVSSSESVAYMYVRLLIIQIWYRYDMGMSCTRSSRMQLSVIQLNQVENIPLEHWNGVCVRSWQAQVAYMCSQE